MTLGPDDKELAAIDKHGLEVKWQEESGFYFPYIDLPNVTIYLERRPYYCDRGRYGFWAESKVPDQLTIDWADGFPRYFFSLQRAFDEMHDWVQFRKLLDVTITKP